MDALELASDFVSEESAEIIQAISKIQRFGFQSGLSVDHPHNNHVGLEKEIQDLYAALDILNAQLAHADRPRIKVQRNEQMIRAAIEKKMTYSHQSLKSGRLSEPLIHPNPSFTIPWTLGPEAV